MAGLLDKLAHAPDGFLFFTVVLGLVALYFGFSGLRRTRLIEDVPTARVRSAHQGYVELVGRAHSLDGEPIVAPLSNTVCCWYRYRVEERADKNWRVLRSGTSDSLFVLRDETGDCVIDPEGAEVTSAHDRTWSDDGGGRGAHGVHARLPPLGGAADVVVDVGGSVLDSLNGLGGRYRYRESVILAGDPLYAMGSFQTLAAEDQSASLDELTGAILREWKQRPDTLRERFDANRDGVVDMQEWQHARTVAKREASREYAANMTREQLHTLRKPGKGRHFLISNLEEFGLLRRYRWRMRLGFLFSVVLGGLLALMVSTRV